MCAADAADDARTTHPIRSMGCSGSKGHDVDSFQRVGPPAGVREQMLNFDPAKKVEATQEKAEQAGAELEEAGKAASEQAGAQHAGAEQQTEAEQTGADHRDEAAKKEAEEVSESAAREKYGHRMSVSSAEKMLSLDTMESEVEAMAAELEAAKNFLGLAEQGTF